MHNLLYTCLTFPYKQAIKASKVTSTNAGISRAMRKINMSGGCPGHVGFLSSCLLSLRVLLHSATYLYR